MKKTAVLAALLLVLLPEAPRAAGDPLDAVESDLAATLKELEAIGSELDRIQETVATLDSATLRVEIHPGGAIPAPAAGRLLMPGMPERRREWTDAEKKAFARGAPLLFRSPFPAGRHAVRFEISHPDWTATPSAAFDANLSKGETLLVRFRVSVPRGQTDPVLSPAPGK